jgi:hypothetical protein
MQPVSDENASVRGRSGPGKGLPATGPSGPLTSVYEISLDIRNYCTFNAPHINTNVCIHYALMMKEKNNNGSQPTSFLDFLIFV